MQDLEPGQKKEKDSKELEDAIEDEDESLDASFEEYINDLFTEFHLEMQENSNYYQKITNFFIKRVGADYFESCKLKGSDKRLSV